MKIKKDDNILSEKIQNNPWRVVLFYGLFGSLWIYSSDKILHFFITDIKIYDELQTIKGWIFILVTAIMLYFIIKVEYFQKIKLLKMIVSKNDELGIFNEEFVAMNTDLEEKVEQLNGVTRVLENQKSYYQNIYNSANVIMFTWKMDGRIIDINNFFEELLGYDQSIIGENWENYLVEPSKIGVVQRVVTQLKKVKQLTNIEEVNVCADGSEVYILWNDTLIYDSEMNEHVVVSFGVNITNERIKDKELYKLAYTDVLTGLGNSAAFEIEADLRIHSNKRFSIYLIDIDNFKQVNNVYDHFVGDEFLKAYATKLLEQLPECSLFRWFGDEFIVLGDFFATDILNDTLQKIERLTNQTWYLQKVEYKPTACVGVATYPSDASSSMELFKNAEIALFDAKEKGNAQIQLFSNQLLNKVLFEESFTRKIEEAILNNLFTLKLQPIYNIDTLELVGAEVLIRLEDGNVNTQAMINHAEKTGQILLIDKFVIHEAIKFVSECIPALANLKISINLSTKSFNSFDLITSLEEIINLYSINSNKIQLEITEYTFIHNIESAKLIMNGLKKLGFLLALDDFGTKYSSLNYLKEIPLDCLKIDKSYVDNICNSNKDNMIVRHIIQLSKGIGLEVVAEGIEEECQKNMLIEMKCDLAQGYLFSKPISPEAFIELIK